MLCRLAASTAARVAAAASPEFHGKELSIFDSAQRNDASRSAFGVRRLAAGFLAGTRHGVPEPLVFAALKTASHPV